MIDIFIGENTTLAKKELNKAINSVSRDGDVSVSRFSDVQFDPELAREAVYRQNLFGGENIVVFEDILSDPQGESFYDKSLKTSPNHIFIRETAPKKPILDIFKYIGEIREFPLFTKPKYENNFAIAESVAMRDKKRAWEEYVRMIARGGSPEAIHGTIFWAIKTVALCTKLDRTEALRAGVNPNNYQRYHTYGKKFLSTELDDHIRELKDMFHKSHRGEGELEHLLEEYILRG